MRFSLVAALSLASYATAQLAVTQAKLSILDSVGITTHSNEFTSASPPTPSHHSLSPQDTLRLSLSLSNNDQPFIPHQAMILWEPSTIAEKGQRGRDHLSLIKVRKGGKAKFELDLSRAPTSLLSLSTGPITATLLVGHPNTTPLRIPLGSFTLPSSLVLPFPYPPQEDLPKAWEVERYSKMPELSWTFRGKEKAVNPVVALGGLAFVLSPWVVLGGATLHLSPSLTTPTPSIFAFLTLLLSFEALIVLYWTSLKLIPTLPYFGLLAVGLAWTGRRALGDLRSRRLSRESGEKKQQ
ncbi:hypothetical protein BCR35DRAFT_298229 [Leucosporidium creatinivorum]|uniref:Ribophorin II C-terminal domain-containing protein n=1 Tax=Leucosporidium creatinivorum TaxID=106004 RepID=A0A1Y2G473_9BASI|nr:hypothetical protein BCR35DRAFT_298229 [Leucosporidium creatinivorum]